VNKRYGNTTRLRLNIFMVLLVWSGALHDNPLPVEAPFLSKSMQVLSLHSLYGPIDWHRLMHGDY
jgi:hypothetical protein